MKALTATLLLAASLLIATSSPAAADLHGKGYETGVLQCPSGSYPVIATGFGAAFRLVDDQGVLVFRSGTLTNADTGDSVTFVAHGIHLGLTPERCTGTLVNPVYERTFDVVFYVTVEPG